MPKISVIVPVYNAAPYLRRCIDSILAQTFTDFELLLIDDGSTDESGGICEEYAANDNRIKVFRKKNGGQSSARNVGLDNARGEYIMFCDDDDKYRYDNLEGMLGLLGDSDCVIGSLWFNGVYRQENCVLKRGVKVTPDFLREFLTFDLLILGAPWNKLFKRTIIEENRLRFNENIIGCEDLVFCWQYFLLCKKITLSDRIGYDYMENLNSLSHKDHSAELCEQSQKALDRVGSRMPKTLFEEFQYAYFWHDLDLIRRVYYSGGVKMQKRYEILGNIKNKAKSNHLINYETMNTASNKILFLIVCLPCRCADSILCILFRILKQKN